MSMKSSQIQRSLFDDGSEGDITFEDAAEELEVSIASIRNWIKTGYLQKTRKKTISRLSWDVFVNEIAGSDKLTKRANKTRTDSHDHDSLSSLILSKLDDEDVEHLSSFYELGLSNSYRNKQGIYYTPNDIAANFFDLLPTDLSNLHFCDPCCGSGNFLVAAIHAGFMPENVHGYDTDDIALRIAESRLAKVTGRPESLFDLKCQDFLESSGERMFDVVFTNPPWGKKLEKWLKDQLANRLKTGKSNDTSSLFFAAALHRLKPGGFMGMLLPESLFSVATFEDIRRVIAEHQIIEFRDYGKPFEGLVTKAKSIVLRKMASLPEQIITCRHANQEHFRSHASFSEMPKNRFNFLSNQSEAELIAGLREFPHTTLRNNAKWGIGIVTGNNKKHIQSEPGEGTIPVWKGADIRPEGLAPPTNFISDNFSRYQQAAKPELFEADEKLIYKFISSDLVFFNDTEQRYVLNSANFVIPNGNFPVSNGVLANYLNCRFVNWVFKSVFETHKVLRADLECLPVFHEFLSETENFEESSLLDYLNIESVDGSYRTKK